MFIPIITKPVYVRFIRKVNGSFELRLVGSTGKSLVFVCKQQFARLFPGVSTSSKVGVVKMDKAFAEEFFEQNR